MALNKVPYTDYQTVVTAANMNDIQDEIISTTGFTTCDTTAAVQAKSAVLTNYVLKFGASVKVKFTYSNTATDPTLNINSTGAKPIKKYGSTAVGTTAFTSWTAGEVVTLVYDGTNYIMVDRGAEPSSNDVGVGLLSGLTTTDKANAVAAINEVDAHCDTNATRLKTLVLTKSSFSSLPQTITNSAITSDMIVVNSVLGTPASQTGDWTVTTSNGSLTVSGTISGSTTLTLYLMPSR